MYSGIIPTIKKAAVDAVEATKPVNFLFGKVTSVSPLKVQVNPKFVLGAGNLVIADTLTKKSVEVTVSGNTGSGGTESHRHSVNIPITVTFDNSLKKGDSVILARMQGGDRYLILDKAVSV